MESRYTLHIKPSEWRWVIVVATGLTFLAFAPFLWVAVTNTQQWQFMGALHNYQDAATYVAKMAQGEEGQWLLRLQHTPEDHGGFAIPVLYLLLGHLARLTSLPVIVMYHVARVSAAVFMYLALYHLAASIWQRVRTRRLFFLIASVGAGLGWFLSPLFTGMEIGQGALWPDLQIPEAFPLYSTLVNVHFPLAIGCLALLTSVLIGAFRPGTHTPGELQAGIPIVAILSLALALLYPQALVPIGGAAALYVLLLYVPRRDPQAGWSTRWLAALVLPAMPVAVYYVAVLFNNPAFAEWTRQNVTPAPSPPMLVLGFGLPLLIGLPALIRAIREFESVDDRIMLLWLVMMLVALYFPTSIQRRFMVGMMIPLAYFTTRAVEEFWFRHVSRRYRNYMLAVLLPLMAVSQVFVLFLPVLPVVFGNPEPVPGTFLERDYSFAFRWMGDRTRSDEVILAAPVVSMWIPGWAGTRVVYGHPFETLDAAAKRQSVEEWYALENSPTCRDLLDRWDVRYIVIGPEERRLGAAGCAEGLNRVATFGEVGVYAP